MKYIITTTMSYEGDSCPPHTQTFLGNSKKECYLKACDSLRYEGSLEIFGMVDSDSKFEGETEESSEKYYEEKLEELEDALTEEDVSYDSQLQAVEEEN